MLKPVSFRGNKEYTSSTDKGETPTVFVLRHLTVDEDAWLEDSYQEYTAERKAAMSYKNKVAQKTLMTLHIGLVEVRNFPVKFERDASAPEVYPGYRPWKEECLASLSKYVRAEVAYAILSNSDISEDERKN